MKDAGPADAQRRVLEEEQEQLEQEREAGAPLTLDEEEQMWVVEEGEMLVF